jgi:hypothetical protein
MNLIREIRDGAIGDNTSLPQLLRKALLLSSLLKNDQLRTWVKQELEGYPDVDSLPPYRYIKATVAGDFIGRIRATDHRLPVEQYDEDVQEKLTVVPIIDSVRQLEQTVADSGEFVTFSLEMTWCRVLPPLFDDAHLVDIRRHAPTGAVQAILDTVRTRLLELVLDLEERFPELASGEAAFAGVDKTQAASIINLHVYGNSNVIAAGANIEQKVKQQFTSGDLTGLLTALGKLGLPAGELDQLSDAIAADGVPTQTGKLGTRVAEWIGRATTKMLEGAASGSPILLTELILHYYGLI